MSDYLEFDSNNKSLKSINLDDFSVDELLGYIESLNKEVDRANKEILKKREIQEEAKKYF
jgi:uncharacterized small protein (DUF1192 family)